MVVLLTPVESIAKDIASDPIKNIISNTERKIDRV
jgi:hypothetical protein